jgi:hypothetical protein
VKIKRPHAYYITGRYINPTSIPFVWISNILLSSWSELGTYGDPSVAEQIIRYTDHWATLVARNEAKTIKVGLQYRSVGSQHEVGEMLV